MEIDEQTLAAKFGVILPHLDERQRRLLLAAEAGSLGYGGISLVARAAGVSRMTVTTGVEELDAGVEPSPGRARRAGGGRKPLTENDPGLLEALDALVEPETRGDPMTRLRWTTKSTRTLAEELTRQGHPISHHSVRCWLGAASSASCRAACRRVRTGRPAGAGAARVLAWPGGGYARVRSRRPTWARPGRGPVRGDFVVRQAGGSPRVQGRRRPTRRIVPQRPARPDGQAARHRLLHPPSPASTPAAGQADRRSQPALGVVPGDAAWAVL